MKNGVAYPKLEHKYAPSLERELAQYQSRINKGIISLFISVIILLFVAVAMGAFGSTDIPLRAIPDMITSWIFPQAQVAAWPESMRIIFFNIRLPRIIMAGLAGAALAIAGAAYQGMFHNPLADPYLTGVSQGAALGAVIGFVLPAGIPVIFIPLLAFTGAILSVTAVYFIARVGKTLPVMTLILGGVAIGAFLAAVTSYLIIINGDKAHGIIYWLLGTFSLSDWWRAAAMAPYVIVGAAVICMFSRSLNLMQLDEEQAKQLGVDVERVKIILLIAATLVTAAAVCFCGIIGFIGIIIPHGIRLLSGPDNRFLLPLSAINGASFMIIADSVSRVALPPVEAPVGVITAVIGVPFFLYLLIQKKRAIF